MNYSHIIIGGYKIIQCIYINGMDNENPWVDLLCCCLIYFYALSLSGWNIDIHWANLFLFLDKHCSLQQLLLSACAGDKRQSICIILHELKVANILFSLCLQYFYSVRLKSQVKWAAWSQPLLLAYCFFT